MIYLRNKRLGILFLIFSIAMILTACPASSGSKVKSGGSSSSAGKATVKASPLLDSMKQVTENAEWEAHRLREEHHRKTQAQ